MFQSWADRLVEALPMLHACAKGFNGATARMRPSEQTWIEGKYQNARARLPGPPDRTAKIALLRT